MTPLQYLSLSSAVLVLLDAPCHAQSPRARPLNSVHRAYAEPRPALDDVGAELPADDSLAEAIVEAYRSNPSLAARRYDLRATDDVLGLALSQTRANAQLQVSGGYDRTYPGDITQAARPLVDRLNNPNIERNDVATQLVIDQPILTGGRARADVLAARADIAAGREALRGVEGDLLVDLIAAYADVRRDAYALRIRETNVRTLQSTLDEVIARREAGELTRTDIAQAETQLQAADVQLNAVRAQLEASRSTFTALVGREPRRLAPEPDLPLLPISIDEAIDTAAQFNPDLAASIATERASRARIASARAEGNPSLSLRGTAGTTGPLSPFDRRDQDVSFGGRATLTIPLLAGGRINALINQASNRNSADFLRIEATQRQMIRAIVSAWNQWITSDRNVGAQDAQLKAARIYYEGTYEEYREGLRSTFDVLFAQNSLRETEIALLGSKRDRYVAQAVLLRQLGQLEAAKLITGQALVEPAIYTRRVMRRSALPWDGVVRALDAIDLPPSRPQVIERIPLGPGEPRMTTPATLPTDLELSTSGAVLGKPAAHYSEQRDKRP